MPLVAFPWLKPIPKDELELLHIQQFQTDYAISLGEGLYEKVAAGADPPDFIAATPDGDRGVDCVQFTVPERRGANAKAEVIRRTLFEAGPSRFSHLQGLLVYVWVLADDAGSGLPLRPNDHQELLEQLAEFRFVPGSGTIYGAGLPAHAPDLGIEYTKAGWGFYATPFLLAAPVSPFFGRMGFELAFVYTSRHSISSLWQECERLIQQHDKPEINDLIFTVGGPDRAGFIHPSEEVVLDFMLEAPSQPSTNHLQRVIIHGWETGRIIQLHPAFRIIDPGRYPGFCPAHRPLAIR